MIPFYELIYFSLAALVLVISPGPNMMYLVSRTLTQGQKAGLISLAGVVCGFLFHILMVAFGLTAVLFSVPYMYSVLKALGVIYLLYLAWQTINSADEPGNPGARGLVKETPERLFTFGLLTNILNPKVALFYLSFFPQFIKPEYGSVFSQSLVLGITQATISFSVNLVIILVAAKFATRFLRNSVWRRVQKWFMASVLTILAIRLTFIQSR